MITTVPLDNHNSCKVSDQYPKNNSVKQSKLLIFILLCIGSSNTPIIFFSNATTFFPKVCEWVSYTYFFPEI